MGAVYFFSGTTKIIDFGAAMPGGWLPGRRCGAAGMRSLGRLMGDRMAAIMVIGGGDGGVGGRDVAGDSVAAVAAEYDCRLDRVA
jgi:hypothetical protein